MVVENWVGRQKRKSKKANDMIIAGKTLSIGINVSILPIEKNYDMGWVEDIAKGT